MDLPDPAQRCRPAGRPPRREPLGVLGLMKAARRNPSTTWMGGHFKLPVEAAGGALGWMAGGSGPALIRYLLIENP